MGIKKWIKKQLGITRLEDLEHFTLSDVVSRLSESYLIFTDDFQNAVGNYIIVPHDKSGVLVLGKHTTVANCIIRGEKTRTVIESLEPDTQSSKPKANNDAKLKHCWREDCKRNLGHPKNECQETDIFITLKGKCGVFTRGSNTTLSETERDYVDMTNSLVWPKKR